LAGETFPDFSAFDTECRCLGSKTGMINDLEVMPVFHFLAPPSSSVLQYCPDVEGGSPSERYVKNHAGKRGIAAFGKSLRCDATASIKFPWASFRFVIQQRIVAGMKRMTIPVHPMVYSSMEKVTERLKINTARYKAGPMRYLQGYR
jgi:hypothetical protein